jgi:hypothetical protein
MGTNWIFLLQIFLVVSTWLLARRFYSNSSWLHTNEKIKMKHSRFPRIVSFFEQGKTQDWFLVYPASLILLATILGGVFLALLFVRGGFNQLEVFLSSQPWWGQVLTWICPILLYYVVRIWWDGKKGQSFLKAKKEGVSTYLSQNVAQKIAEIDADRIPTYPRFTIYELNIQGNSRRKLIFDSSDFIVINTAFGIIGNYNFNSILAGKNIIIRESECVVESVRIDFLDIFDDYSINPFGYKHTDVYEGKDVPYNIQIILEVRSI